MGGEERVPFLRGGTCEDAAETPARLSGEVGARASELNCRAVLAGQLGRYSPSLSDARTLFSRWACDAFRFCNSARIACKICGSVAVCG